MDGDLSLTAGLDLAVGTEPILAWRAWALTGKRDGSGLLLRPVAGRSRPWRPQEPAEAACKHARLHQAPQLACSCGLHGTHQIETLRRTKCPGVLGRVAFWGRIIEHDLGYRAQFGYPQRLGLICQFCFWQWGEYGVSPQVVGWFGWDELIPLCWHHLGVAQRFGMEPRRILSARTIEVRLRNSYGVDPLAMGGRC